MQKIRTHSGEKRDICMQSWGSSASSQFCTKQTKFFQQEPYKLKQKHKREAAKRFAAMERKSGKFIPKIIDKQRILHF